MLWDFLLAFGVHLNVLCVIAQLLLMREEVMSSPRFDLCMLCAIPYSFHTLQPHAPLADFSPARSRSSCWNSSHACTRSPSRSLRRTCPTSIRHPRTLRLIDLAAPIIFHHCSLCWSLAFNNPRSCSIPNFKLLRQTCCMYCFFLYPSLPTLPIPFLPCMSSQTFVDVMHLTNATITTCQPVMS